MGIAARWTNLRDSSDPVLSHIQEALSQGQPATLVYYLVQGKLLYKNMLVFPTIYALVPLVLHECHDSLTGGHSGMLKTLMRASAWLYWQGMKRDIKLMWLLLKSASKISILPYRPLAYSNDCQFLITSGKISLSTLLMCYQSWRIQIHSCGGGSLKQVCPFFIGLKHPYTAFTGAAVFVWE